jgi:hypothetical protein
MRRTSCATPSKTLLRTWNISARNCRRAECPYVPVDEYFKIYGNHLNFDEAKALYLSHYRMIWAYFCPFKMIHCSDGR